MGIKYIQWVKVMGNYQIRLGIPGLWPGHVQSSAIIDIVHASIIQ